jgi:hypothetical protein
MQSRAMPATGIEAAKRLELAAQAEVGSVGLGATAVAAASLTDATQTATCQSGWPA